MQTPLNIVFHDIPRSEALEQHIRDKLESLEQLYPKLTRCNVTIEKPHRHKHQGNTFNVRIDLHVPGEEIVVNRDAHEDAYVALREAFDAAKRVILRRAQKVRGDVKHHSKPASEGKWPEEEQ